MFFLRRAWLVDTAERSVSTAAEVAVAMLTADGLGILTVEWSHVGSVAGLSAVVAILKALAKGRHAEAQASHGEGRHVDHERPVA